MAPPPPPAASRVAGLFMRILTFAFLLVSLIVLATDSVTVQVTDNSSSLGDIIEAKLRFKDIYAFRYMIATIAIGLAYTLLQIALTLYFVGTGNRMISGDGNLLFDFYGDKVISYLLATGAAAAIGSSRDLKAGFGGTGNVDKFFDKAYASAGLLLAGFLCTAISSVFSSYALPKTVQ